MYATRRDSFRAGLCLVLLLGVLLSPSSAPAGETVLAYVGPGAGLGMLGSLLALAAAIVIGLLGLLLYPIMLLRKALRKPGQVKAVSGEE